MATHISNLESSLRWFRGKSVKNINFFLFVFSTPNFYYLSRPDTNTYGIFTYFMVFGISSTEIYNFFFFSDALATKL